MEEDFTTRANVKRNEYLLKTEELFVTNKAAWFSAFASHFRQICAQIRKMQEESALSAISYLEYNMLYNNFINRRYVTQVCAYGEKSYLDKSQRILGEYDVSFLFVYFDKLWDDLINLKRRLVGQAAAVEITKYMLDTLPDFYSYLANIARFAVADCIDKSPFVDIDKNEVFMINVGDYMAKTETVYTESKDKDSDKLTDWFHEQLYKEYVFGDYSNLDFSGKSFAYTDLRYAQFRNSNLKDTDLSGSSLIGVNFRHANMVNCRMNSCSIYEADFSDANLKNASLIDAHAKIGLTDEKEWKFVGFLPAVFRNADLTGVDFTGADLTGADFSGAVLTDAVFTNANLTGADFTRADLSKTDFSGAVLIDAIFPEQI